MQISGCLKTKSSPPDGQNGISSVTLSNLKKFVKGLMKLFLCIFRLLLQLKPAPFVHYESKVYFIVA